VPYLRLFARVLGAYYHMRAGCAAGLDTPRGKLARLYILRLLPEHAALAEHAKQGASDLFALSAEDLAA
jgi:acyl-CoA dehydrogenase